jgi:hypothetical protein
MKSATSSRRSPLARWSRTLSALVSPAAALQALDITGKTAGNHVVGAGDGRRHRQRQSGGTIADPLTRIFGLPVDGQPHGLRGRGDRLARHMLSKIADFYEDQVAAAVKALTSILRAGDESSSTAAWSASSSISMYAAAVQGLRPDQVADALTLAPPMAPDDEFEMESCRACHGTAR